MDIQELETDLANIKHAIEKLEEARNDLNEIDGLNDEFKMLEMILSALDDERLNKERKLENLEEEAYYEENEELWRKEKEQEQKEYWSSQFDAYELY